MWNAGIAPYMQDSPVSGASSAPSTWQLPSSSAQQHRSPAAPPPQRAPSAPAARRLFDQDTAASAGSLSTAVNARLETACSSNVASLEQTCAAAAAQQDTFQSPCPAPAPLTPTFELLRRVFRHCQRSSGPSRACRVLPGLAPCDDSTHQQLHAWLSAQEAELAAAAAERKESFTIV